MLFHKIFDSSKKNYFFNHITLFRILNHTNVQRFHGVRQIWRHWKKNWEYLKLYILHFLFFFILHRFLDSLALVGLITLALLVWTGMIETLAEERAKLIQIIYSSPNFNDLIIFTPLWLYKSYHFLIIVSANKILNIF